MTDFLSDMSIAQHKDYVRNMRLKYSILEKSIPNLAGKDISDIRRMRIPFSEREYAISLLADIRLHDIFFSSFSPTPYRRLSYVQRGYLSEASLLDEIYKKATGVRGGFLTVGIKRGKTEVSVSDDCASLFENKVPILAIDLCEHAYFLDYAFSNEKYVASALPYLDLSRLTGKTNENYGG